MIDYRLRVALAGELQQVLGGRMLVSDIDEAFFFRYSATDDRGVQEIAAMCFSLFSDQTAWSERRANQTQDERRKTCQIASPATHDMLTMAVLFLKSNQEYRWTEEKNGPGAVTLFGAGLFAVLPAMMGVAFFTIPESLATTISFGLSFSLVGVICMFASLRLVFHRFDQPRRRRGQFSGQGGDCDAWPFFEWSEVGG